MKWRPKLLAKSMLRSFTLLAVAEVIGYLLHWTPNQSLLLFDVLVVLDLIIYFVRVRCNDKKELAEKLAKYPRLQASLQAQVDLSARTLPLQKQIEDEPAKWHERIEDHFTAGLWQLAHLTIETSPLPQYIGLMTAMPVTEYDDCYIASQLDDKCCIFFKTGEVFTCDAVYTTLQHPDKAGTYQVRGWGHWAMPEIVRVELQPKVLDTLDWPVTK